MSLEGWKQDGEGLIKWFGDHWKHAVNEDVAAQLDQEAALRNPGATPTLVNSVSEVWAPAAAPEAPAETPAVEAAPEAGAAPAADASATEQPAEAAPTTEGA